MINLTAKNIKAIEEKARETAQMFVDEFNEVLDPATTDWDSVAWQDDRRDIFRSGELVGEQYDAAWAVYQKALIEETRRLVEGE